MTARACSNQECTPKKAQEAEGSYCLTSTSAAPPSQQRNATPRDATVEKERPSLTLTLTLTNKGLEWSFTANGFETFWLQSISMSMARTQAESIVAFIGANQKEGWVDLVHPINTN